jgi:hypothetical protein
LADSTRSSQQLSIAHRHGELLAHVRQLYADLDAIVQRDPEQEVLGVALPVLDGILAAARDHLLTVGSSGGITSAMVDLISFHTVERAVPVRAVDTWLVVGQVLAALDLHQTQHHQPEGRLPSLDKLDTSTTPEPTTASAPATSD